MTPASRAPNEPPLALVAMVVANSLSVVTPSE